MGKIDTPENNTTGLLDPLSLQQNGSKTTDVVSTSVPMASAARITLYVDVVSPFAYEAYHIFQNDAIFKACDIRYVPIFLGGLMKACGNTAPVFVKNKDKWIQTERLRWARAFNVPMKEEAPPGFPPLTLTAMRALCVVAQLDDGHGQKKFLGVLDALFRQLWVEHQPVHEPATVKETLGSVLGREEADKVMGQIGTAGKRILAENTDKAFADGAFGLPWMVCTNATGQTESFWGVDHLGQVTQFLGLQKPRDGGWRAVL
ncbi:Thioredoxin-like fold protein [Niveomyces insectorum RCEF 264]|uniref:Glutathione S-transferase kappa 1 n=1 Tax=Niveomyces insectorum RCEF 264 TaxID=1081102 RepID=A0A167NUU2_9HYPO|nr:Thioredoxin-like fold protein [Niveomyces insectorum RCEF 264]